ncbi:MAG TPA: hypothetical protein VM694_17785 [Polyangium sp.]|nr:hypothetical protein [Polyangium sp.]
MTSTPPPASPWPPAPSWPPEPLPQSGGRQLIVGERICTCVV